MASLPAKRGNNTKQNKSQLLEVSGVGTQNQAQGGMGVALSNRQIVAGKSKAREARRGYERVSYGDRVLSHSDKMSAEMEAEMVLSASKASD